MTFTLAPLSAAHALAASCTAVVSAVPLDPMRIVSSLPFPESFPSPPPEHPASTTAEAAASAMAPLHVFLLIALPFLRCDRRARCRRLPRRAPGDSTGARQAGG